MFSQILDLGRIIIISFAQPIVLGILGYFAYRILKRKNNFLTKNLSLFYIFLAVGFFLNIIFLLFKLTEVEFIINFIYLIISFLIIYAPIFIIVFIIYLLKDISIKLYYLIIFTYAIVCIIVLLIPGGIQITKANNWIPEYSWILFYTVYISFSIYVLLPTIFLSYKLLDYFEDKALKKKYKFFIFGVFLGYIIIYGAILYNTWQFPPFRRIWSILSPILLITSSLLIYYGIGQDL